MDIICAKCGKHFSSIESAREHNGHCKQTSQSESMHWVPSPKSKITPEEWENMMKLINPQGVSPTNLEPSYIPSGFESVDEPNTVSSGVKRIDEPNTVPPVSSEKIIRPPEKKEIHQNKQQKTSNQKIQRWLVPLLMIFALSIVGLGPSMFVGNFIPLWLLLGFSVIFSIEKWFYFYTTKYKVLGKLYRLLLNLSILSLLGIIVWSGTKLFSLQLANDQLSGSLLFLTEFVFLVLLWRIVSKNSWRWPSMKLTVFSLVCLFLIFAFARVEPLYSYKSSLTMEWVTLRDFLSSKWTTYQAEQGVVGMQKQQLTEKPTTQLPPTLLQTTHFEEFFNDYRQAHGLNALIFTDDLNRIAELRLAEIQTNYSHFSAGNYNRHLAENINMISFGSLSDLDAFNSWKSSPGHNANMLDPNYKYTGYAIGGGYAVQVFTEYITLNGEPQLPPGWVWPD